MGHCGGGEGPDTFDMVSALERWVENSQAPALVVASHSTGGKVDRTRPLALPGKPWFIDVVVEFCDERRAIAFEKY